MTRLDNKTSKENDDLFDVWNDFASSTRTQGSSTNLLTQSTYQNAAVDEQTSNTILPGSTNNFQEMDFGSFSQSDHFSGLSSNQHDSVEVNRMQSEVPVSWRIIMSFSSNLRGRLCTNATPASTYLKTKKAVNHAFLESCCRRPTLLLLATKSGKLYVKVADCMHVYMLSLSLSLSINYFMFYLNYVRTEEVVHRQTAI
ncbi:uncharacterized protein LOC127797331 [Diospyros lotus]|uniref:uncharacterized protein LOC127797331 n=1 Tax=Diospyros lotus TaxID=55363 RepID=UPI0022582EB8|nr:uncharacterized protein LOC127797331 [Diospyros lotus]